MRKKHQTKLALHRETVRHLATKELLEAQGAATFEQWSNPPQCDPACSSQTLSCTL